MAPDRKVARWLHRLGLGRPRPEDSVGLEVEHHLAEVVDRLVDEGWTQGDARREAERRFGDRRRYAARMQRSEEAQAVRDQWIATAEVVRGSVIAVARTARREPGFLLGVVAMLGLGIGANATMYGIIDRLWLRGPEHVVDPSRVFRVFVEGGRTMPGGGVRMTSALAYPDVTDLRAHSGLEAVAALVPRGLLVVGSGDQDTRAWVEDVSAELFTLLGVVPHVGRFFDEGDEEPGAQPTAVLGFAYWQGAYAGDASVVGQTITINGHAYTIVGVAPRDFTGVDLRLVDVWRPFATVVRVETPNISPSSCLVSRTCYTTRAVVRLSDGVALDAAEAEATALHVNARRDVIATGRYSAEASMQFAPLIAALGPDGAGESRVAVWLAGVSIVVLLIACANVANLLMARGLRRKSDMGVRLALGASRRLVVAQVLLESLILAGLGAVFALLLARLGGAFVRSVLLPEVHFPEGVFPSRLLAFTVIAATASSLLAGVGPALQARRAAVSIVPNRDGLGASARRPALARALTVAQAALTAMLLVGAGLFVTSLQALRAHDIGYDVDRLVLVELIFRDADPDPTIPTATLDEALRRVRRLPSVEAAAATTSLFGTSAAMMLRPSHLDSIPRLPGGGPYYYAVPPEYFETVGLAVTRGRGIRASDTVDGARVAVISETMARTLWPDGDPLGGCLMRLGNDQCFVTVVGVVEDATRQSYFDPPFMAYYLPSTQIGRAPNGIYVRSRERGEDALAEVTDALQSLSPDVRYARVRALRDVLTPQTRSWTLGATMFTLFGILALIVAALGLYSVLAFDVANRSRELGIRAALGAQRTRILGSVLAQGVELGTLGVALGLIVAYFAAPYAQDLLFETSPRDPRVLGSVGAFLLLVSVLASLVPGLRATRIDPMTALKSD